MSALGRLLRSGTMSRQFREIHTLDKDLERISAAERAGVQSLRALTRTGIAVLFVAVMVVVAAGMAARGGTAGGRCGIGAAAGSGAGGRTTEEAAGCSSCVTSASRSSSSI